MGTWSEQIDRRIRRVGARARVRLRRVSRSGVRRGQGIDQNGHRVLEVRGGVGGVGLLDPRSHFWEVGETASDGQDRNTIYEKREQKRDGAKHG